VHNGDDVFKLRRRLTAMPSTVFRREVQLSDEQLRAASNAMYEAMVDDVVDHISTLHYDFDKALGFFRSCREESDRATPVLIFSFIENAIKQLFSAELSPDTPGGVASLFGQSGPLATTNTRIRMLAALGWIFHDTAKNLDVLRKIRNQFAHDPPQSGFLDERVQALLGNVHAYEAPLIQTSFLKSIDLPPIDPTRIDGKTLFIARSALIFSRLTQELLSAPGCLRKGLPAGAVLGRDFDRIPSILREAQRLGVRVALEAVFWRQD
jgi:DNA-binding MltR family transcriptional regulator